MEKLKIISARSTWLFDIDDLNPRGRNILGELIDWAKIRYNFSASPSSPADLDKESKGLVFKGGSFPIGDETIHVEVSVFTDGLAGNSYSSTRDTEAFLEDMLNSAAKEFSLKYKPDMIRNKVPLSELDVRLDQPISRLNSKLESFAKKISAISPIPADFQAGGIGFWADTSQSALKLSAFAIERKVNAPFSENRFYSRASLHTDDHLRLIGELEQLLAG